MMADANSEGSEQEAQRLIKEHRLKTDELEIILAAYGEQMPVRPLEQILAAMVQVQDDLDWASQKMSMLLVELAALVRGEHTIPPA